MNLAKIVTGNGLKNICKSFRTMLHSAEMHWSVQRNLFPSIDLTTHDDGVEWKGDKKKPSNFKKHQGTLIRGLEWFVLRSEMKRALRHSLKCGSIFYIFTGWLEKWVCTGPHYSSSIGLPEIIIGALDTHQGSVELCIFEEGGVPNCHGWGGGGCRSRPASTVGQTQSSHLRYKWAWKWGSYGDCYSVA